jgi:hypothetical protein
MNRVVLSAIVASISVAASAQHLTGITYYTTDANGNYSGGGFWDTVAGNGAWDVHFYENGTPINPAVTMSHHLSPGNYEWTFEYSDNRGTGGLSLFFNDNTTQPAISIHSEVGTGTGFQVTPAGAPVWNLNMSTSPAPGTASFTDPVTGYVVTVTGFSHFSGPSHQYGTGYGTLSLTVVPEPASFAALGVGALALLRRRRR